MLSLDRAGVVAALPTSFRVGRLPECYEFFFQRARNPALLTSPLNLKDVTHLRNIETPRIRKIQQFQQRTKTERKFIFASFFVLSLVALLSLDLTK